MQRCKYHACKVKTTLQLFQGDIDLISSDLILVT